MTIFGDQSWRKIQRFLLYKEKLVKSKSLGIKKNDKLCYTYRSVKAIQNKIYQIKPEIE